MLTANYTGGTVAVVPIQADGSLGNALQVISHFGSLGPNTGRQEAPHPHMMSVDPTGNYVLVNDLGLDATIVYSFDATAKPGYVWHCHILEHEDNEMMRPYAPTF